MHTALALASIASIACYTSSDTINSNGRSSPSARASIALSSPTSATDGSTLSTLAITLSSVIGAVNTDGSQHSPSVNSSAGRPACYPIPRHGHLSTALAFTRHLPSQAIRSTITGSALSAAFPRLLFLGLTLPAAGGNTYSSLDEEGTAHAPSEGSGQGADGARQSGRQHHLQLSNVTYLVN